ncbi:hypothetical protein FUSNEC_GEN_287_02145 [Fusobacterium necrophorum subsp. funduliforme]|uniref:hypothetical protein n=1 Tax=Fusobacterium necrophorum TaxID=859 RepID=UPI00370F4237
MTQEKIERIMTLENKRKEMEQEIEYTKKLIKRDEMEFFIVSGYKYHALPLSISIEMVKMAVEKREAELRAIEKELEAM